MSELITKNYEDKLNNKTYDIVNVKCSKCSKIWITITPIEEPYICLDHYIQE